MSKSTRRDFLKTSALTAGTVAAGWQLAANVHAGGSDAIRVGLVGCGGRGSGAAEQCLRADANVRLVCVADTFRDRADRCIQDLRNNRDVNARVDVAPERVYIGLEAYRNVLQNCDLVILATPPGFRPTHIAAAVEARKHIFTEKPVCVDGPGYRTVMAAYETATQRNLSVVAGTQRRYQTGYRESMQRIHDGALGTITSANCYWNQGGLWHRERTQGMTDVEWQIRNWLYFTWLSGDHIVEQHVHNLDVINWALGNGTNNAVPVRCIALGGRQVRTQAHFGHIFDHFAADLEYPGGVHVLSTCRQINGTPGRITESVTGTQGTWAAPNTSGPPEERRANYAITGQRAWTFQGRNDNQPYEAEHVALIRSIRQGPRINDLRRVAESSLTAVMARMAAYSGQVVTWDAARQSELSLMPANLRWDMNLPVPPVAMPGTTRAF